VETVSQKDNTPKRLRDIIGITHVNGQYHLTDKDFLNEGADRILALGSRVIKVWFHKPWDSYSCNSQWPKAGSMVEIAQSRYFPASRCLENHIIGFEAGKLFDNRSETSAQARSFHPDL